MLPPAPIPPLPPLSDQDRALLAIFVDPSLDPWAAAANLGLSEHDLTLWFARDDIQHWLSVRRQIRLERLDIITTHATGEALQALREIVNDRADPVETRRAATLILRIARGAMGFPAHASPSSTTPPPLRPSPPPFADILRLTGLHLTKSPSPPPSDIPHPTSDIPPCPSTSHLQQDLDDLRRANPDAAPAKSEIRHPHCPTTAAFEEAIAVLRAQSMTLAPLDDDDDTDDDADDADLDNDSADAADMLSPCTDAAPAPVVPGPLSNPTPDDSS